jgi:hypothetical protein
MRIIQEKNLLNVFGGTGLVTGSNSVEKDELSIYAKVGVPASANGQTALLQVQVVENTFLNRLIY